MEFLVIAVVVWLTTVTPSQASILRSPGIDRHLDSNNGRKLRGRFLHITDMHPDPFYQIYSSTEEDNACHAGHGPAGYYGAETSDCDSPFALVNATFRWLDKHLKDDIDFVIWTGDSARHDNDERHPRNQKQVTDQNQMLVDEMLQVFGASKNDGWPGPQPDLKIPVVPSFGNNDILPHNIFEKGPNHWTKLYQGIWRPFIPEEQRHGFDRGGWFYVEVIPNKLAVFSLNTMYFFSNNAAVDGCASHKEPGYEHFEWLRIQLQFMRQRGMKAIMSGHVPPARTEEKVSWDETCWQKYALWMRQYRDVVVGSVYGHMNIEHFVLQDFEDIDPKVANGFDMDDPNPFERIAEARSKDSYEIAVNGPKYLNALRELWSDLPAAPGDDPENEDNESEQDKYHNEIGGEWAERFSISMVTASVVPNFFSVLRIYEYNITGLDDADVWTAAYAQPPPPDWEPVVPAEETSTEHCTPAEDDQDNDVTQLLHLPHQQVYLTPDDFESECINHDLRQSEDIYIHNHDERIGSTKKKKKKKKPKFTVPLPPPKTSPPGPAYSPQTFSWTRYVQYFANNTRINNDLDARASRTPASNPINAQGWNSGKHADEKPGEDKKKPEPLDFEFEVEYDTGAEHDAYGLYKQDGLVMKRWVRLAGRIGEFDPNELEDEDTVVSREHGERNELKAQEVQEDIGGDTALKTLGKKERKEAEKARRAWFTFVSRAVTGTLNEKELQERYGSG